MSTARAESAPLVLSFAQIGAIDLHRVGGKGAKLSELARAGLPVPAGFCVTTAAFDQFAASCPRFGELVDQLEDLAEDDLEGAGRLATELREHLGAQPVPEAIASAALEAWRGQGEPSCAVRSSATAEDLPEASFAGQQDSYLNVIGAEPLVARIRDCWASLFTDRAVIYRRQQGLGHRGVSLSVVIQRMVPADKAGILFTADPLSGHRGVASIDAGRGLGEALVGGTVSAENLRVDRRSGQVIERRSAEQAQAVVPTEGGGVETRALTAVEQQGQVLDDAELQVLLELAQRIEDHFGEPQDIEWCFVTGQPYIVQSRPITSLYPLAEPHPEGQTRELLLNVNHLQVMTDAMPPMAHAMVRQFLPMGRGLDEQRPCPWVRSAGGRVFMDLGPAMRFAPTRHMVLRLLTVADELAGPAVARLAQRRELRRGPRVRWSGLLGFALPSLGRTLGWLWLRRPEGAIAELAQKLDASQAAARARVQAAGSLVERLRQVRREMYLLFSAVVPVPPMLIAALAAGRLAARLGGASEEERAALGRGIAGNITTEMDLAVGDLADVVRPHAELRQQLLDGETELSTLTGLPGGDGLKQALDEFLRRFGMRGPGEFDISRPRWRDDPSSLLRALAGNLRSDEPGRHRAHQAELTRQAEEMVATLRQRARQRPLGWLRARLFQRFVRVHRELLGAREHPKFLLIRMMGRVRELIREAGAELESQGRLARAEDVWFLDDDELLEAVGGPAVELRARVNARQEAHRRHRKLSSPKVMTSDGEIPVLRHDRGTAPEGALVGTGVSAGVVEGVTRVIRDPGREVLHKGEILVARFTDPGWTPLFINAAGLVMEVGGAMTHGSVVAREYGIPAVVCVPDATSRIRSGQRVRVDGDRGWVELLDEERA